MKKLITKVWVCLSQIVATLLVLAFPGPSDRIESNGNLKVSARTRKRILREDLAMMTARMDAREREEEAETSASVTEEVRTGRYIGNCRGGNLHFRLP